MHARAAAVSPRSCAIASARSKRALCGQMMPMRVRRMSPRTRCSSNSSCAGTVGERASASIAALANREHSSARESWNSSKADRTVLAMPSAMSPSADMPTPGPSARRRDGARIAVATRCCGIAPGVLGFAQEIEDMLGVAAPHGGDFSRLGHAHGCVARVVSSSLKYGRSPLASTDTSDFRPDPPSPRGLREAARRRRKRLRRRSSA
jgi:hypothetical protein